MPSTPLNGARMVFCATSARCASTCACAVAAAVSFCWASSFDTSWSRLSFCQRSACTRASCAEACSALSVASSLAVFRRTSTAPAATGCPASNSIERTTPPASVVTSVPLTATEGADRLAAAAPAFGLGVVGAFTATAGCGMLSKKLLVCLRRSPSRRTRHQRPRRRPASGSSAGDIGDRGRAFRDMGPQAAKGRRDRGMRGRGGWGPAG